MVRAGSKPAPGSNRGLKSPVRSHEYIRALHSPAGRNVAADDGAGGRRHRGLSASAGGAAATGRFPDRPGCRAASGGKSRNHGGNRGAAAGAPVRADFRPHRHDIHEQLGSTSIVLQFDLDRNVDAAAQDVQAAITAANRQLPTDLPSPPIYRKVNPADSPILVIAAYSDSLPITAGDDLADTVVAQQIAQIKGVAQVVIGGEQKPAVRIQVDPAKLQARGLTLEDVRGTIALATSNAAKGGIHNDNQSFTIAANDQLQRVADYDSAILATATVRRYGFATS